MAFILDLVPYLILFLALAIALSLRAFVQATQIIVAKLLGPFGFVGGLLTSGFNAVASEITRVLDEAIKYIEVGVGASWHLTARVMGWTMEAFRDTAHTLNAAVKATYQFASRDYLSAALRELRALVHRLGHAGTVALHETVVINRKGDRALARNVLPRLRSLERETAHVLAPEVAGIRHAERGLSRDLTALERYVRSHPWHVVSEAFVGAVAVALAKLGLDWIRCDRTKAAGKAICNNDLSGLLSVLGIGALALEVATLRQQVELAQKVVHEVTAGVEAVLGE